MPLAFFVLTQYRRVTDRQTDRHVAIAITRASIASRGYKLSNVRKLSKSVPCFDFSLGA